MCVSKQRNRWVKSYSMSAMLELQIWEESPPRGRCYISDLSSSASSAPCWRSREKWHLFSTKQSGQQKLGRGGGAHSLPLMRQQPVTRPRQLKKDNAIICNTNETWWTTLGAKFWSFLQCYHVFKTHKSVGGVRILKKTKKKSTIKVLIDTSEPGC